MSSFVVVALRRTVNSHSFVPQTGFVMTWSTLVCIWNSTALFDACPVSAQHLIVGLTGPLAYTQVTHIVIHPILTSLLNPVGNYACLLPSAETVFGPPDFACMLLRNASNCRI